jgi:hypothetical protein
MYHNRVRNVAFYLLIIAFTLFLGCGKSDFQDNCIKAKHILSHASNLLIPSVVKNADGVDKNVIFRNDNSKSKKYLDDKGKDIKRLYDFIKGNIDDSNKNNCDAIYAAAYINELNYFFTGNYFDNKYYYIELLEKNKNCHLSEWIINDFFAPLKKNQAYKKSWIDLDYEKKKEMILKIITGSK